MLAICNSFTRGARNMRGTCIYLILAPKLAVAPDIKILITVEFSFTENKTAKSKCSLFTLLTYLYTAREEKRLFQSIPLLSFSVGSEFFV